MLPREVLKAIFIFVFVLIGLLIVSVYEAKADTVNIEVIDADALVIYRLYMPDGSVNESASGSWFIAGKWPEEGQNVKITAIKVVDDVVYESLPLEVFIDLKNRPVTALSVKVVSIVVTPQ